MKWETRKKKYDFHSRYGNKYSDNQHKYSAHATGMAADLLETPFFVGWSVWYPIEDEFQALKDLHEEALNQDEG